LRCICCSTVSGSLSDRDLTNLRQGAAEVVRLARPDDRVRLVTFTDVVRLHDDLDAASVGPIFQDLKPDGDTALHDALAPRFISRANRARAGRSPSCSATAPTRRAG
jgi:hypothetical protein